MTNVIWQIDKTTSLQWQIDKMTNLLNSLSAEGCIDNLIAVTKWQADKITGLRMQAYKRVIKLNE
jgi:hypothetical protein